MRQILKGGNVILVVEDEENDAILMRRAVDRIGQGLKAYFVPDGEEAIAYLSGTGKFADRQLHPTPGVVLLDLKLPRRSGLDVLDWIRRDSTFKLLPVIALSASGITEQVNEVYRRGANAFMVKPVDIGALQGLMETIGTYLARTELPDPPKNR